MSSAEDREPTPPPWRAARLWRPGLPASPLFRYSARRGLPPRTQSPQRSLLAVLREEACHWGDVPDYVDEPVVVDVGRPGVEPAGGRGVGSNDRLGRIRPSVAVGSTPWRHRIRRRGYR